MAAGNTEGDTGGHDMTATQQPPGQPAPADPAARAAWARGLTRTAYVPHQVVREDAADGTIRLRSALSLPPSVRCTGDWLHRWAFEAPDRIAVSERAADGAGWRDVSYGDLLAQVRHVAAALLARGMGAGDPVAILSGNGLDHLILSLAAQYIGVPVSPLAEQYALIPEAHPRLIHVVQKLAPALLYVEDATRYRQALSLPELAGIPVLASRGMPAGGAGGATLEFAAMLRHPVGPDLDAAHAAVGPETLAKILFTSGSSGDPKGVETTQRMMCVNQAQLAATLPFLADHPPRITDWLPWNHVFGGSHNVNMMLAHGGTLVIDHGKPVPHLFDITRANMHDRPGSLLFNVPVGHALTAAAAEADAAFQARVFGGLDLIFYAGATLPQELWEKLEQFCLAQTGGLPLMISSWGLTETAPACLIVHEPIGRAGVIGVPVPGVEIKLIPDADMRCEIRVRGPNVTPGYFRDPARTAEAFDEEGFFITGDAVTFLDPQDASRGLVFDGRISEDFKLATGTWVQAGALRLAVLQALAGIAQDVVMCGHDRGDVGLMIFPRNPAPDAPDVITDPALMAQVAQALSRLNGTGAGSARRIARALILGAPPSVGGQEITDKGSLNPRRVLTRRAALLDRLYDDTDPAVIRP